MFTWMCPQCGREVPPSYSECPDCARKAAERQPDPQAAPPQQPPPQYPPQPQYAPPQPQYAPPPPHQQYAPPPPQHQQLPYATIPSAHPQYQQPPYAPQYGQQPQYMPPPPRAGLPSWAMALLFSVAICGGVFGTYWLVGSNKGAASKPTAAVESPAAKAGAKTSPYQKFIEIAGVRFVEDARKKTTQVRFVLINHSNADIPGLSGNVTVWGRTRNSEEDAEGSFTFTSDLKGYETRDITVPLNTKKKIYELPDWQNVSTDIQITAPQ
jgi:hypothetical protein